MVQNAVLMIGWEYPPHNSGGLGVACQGMTESLAAQGQAIYFTLPYLHSDQLAHMHVVGCADPSWQTVAASPPFSAYAPVTTPVSRVETNRHLLGALPQSQLEHQVNQYATYVTKASKHLKAKVGGVHAHDWMGFPAAMQIQRKLHKPFIAHVHSTEFDRIPTGTGSQYIKETERSGLVAADHVIAVSNYTKRMLVREYNIDPNKISVVYNGIDPLPNVARPPQFWAAERPVVVFLGRLTMQKGAEYFLDVARSVLQHKPNALFIVAGDGDMYKQLLFSTAYQQLSAQVLFTGFLRGKQKEMLLDRADVFVMSSISEPFGLVALEAAQRSTPVIISTNSGVREVLPGAISAEHWDSQKMSESILTILDNAQVAEQQVAAQHENLAAITWDKAALNIRSIYRQVFEGVKETSS